MAILLPEDLTLSPYVPTSTSFREGQLQFRTESTVKGSKLPSQTWRNFLKNHSKEIVSIDFIVVPTVRFTMLYILIFLSVDRRRVLQLNVTEHPTAEWSAQQAIEAFPWDTAPKYLLRDRDAILSDE